MVVMATATAESTAADATSRGRERSHAKGLMRRRPPPSGCRLHPAWRLAPKPYARAPTGKCCPNRVTRSRARCDRGSGDIPPLRAHRLGADVRLEMLGGEGVSRCHQVGRRPFEDDRAAVVAGAR